MFEKTLNNDMYLSRKEITDENVSYSKKAKAGMIILIIINALFLLLTFLDYSLTAGMSCSIIPLVAAIFDASEHPLFAEACQIVENNSFYFQVHENYLHDIWTMLKTAHIFATLAFAYLMMQKKPKLNSKKLTSYYILCTILISLAGMTVLQFAVHNRTEANENAVIISEYGKEDTVITNYKDAEKVRVYIIETYGSDRYVSFEGAVDVTVGGKTYTFFGTESPDYENMEKFISLFDESIVEIDKTYWGTEEFEIDDTYLNNKEILDRIFDN